MAAVDRAKTPRSPSDTGATGRRTRGKSASPPKGRTAATRKPGKKSPARKAARGGEFRPDSGWRTAGSGAPGRAPKVAQAKHPADRSGKKGRAAPAAARTGRRAGSADPTPTDWINDVPAVGHTKNKPRPARLAPRAARGKS